VHAGSELWYCYLRRNSVVKTRNVEKVLRLEPLFQDYLGSLVAVDFCCGGSITGIPPRRVFRHTWRDITQDMLIVFRDG
jgi:hypothetical protein